MTTSAMKLLFSVTVENYPQASILNYFAFVGKGSEKENKICESVINNGLMVYPPARIIVIIIAG